MGGELHIDHPHGSILGHLDFIQYGEWGNIHERYDKYGNLFDVRFRPSNILAKDLGVLGRYYPLSGGKLPYQENIARSG